MMRRAAQTLVPVLLLATGLADAGGTVEEVRPLRPGASVEVEIIAGSVEVIGWNRKEIKIQATLGRHESMDIDEDGRIRRLRAFF